MENLFIKYNFLCDWLICKKSIIFNLLEQKLPILQFIINFIVAYCKHLKEIINHIRKQIGDLEKTIDKKSILEVLELMEIKQVENLANWQHLLSENQNYKDGQKFQLFFQNLDINIEYYLRIRFRLNQLTVQKPIQKFPEKFYPSQKDNTKSYNKISKSPERKSEGNLPSRISEFAKTYDDLGNNTSFESKNKRTIERKIGTIKSNNGTPKQQLSPYKSVRYTNTQSQKNKTNKNIVHKTRYQYKYESQPIQAKSDKFQLKNYPKYREFDQKQLKYRMELQKDMEKDIHYKKQFIKVKQLTVPHKSPKIEGLTQKKQKVGYYDINKYNTNNKYSYSSKRSQPRRYQYLAKEDNDKADNIVTKDNPETDRQQIHRIRRKLFDEQGNLEVQNKNHIIKQNQRHQYFEQLFPDTSIQSLHADNLGEQLDRQLPILIKNTEFTDSKQSNQNNEERSLEQMLAMSLLSSKRWTLEEQNNNEYQEDSLDDIVHTGKFNILNTWEQSREDSHQYFGNYVLNHHEQNDDLAAFEDSLDMKHSISFGK